MIKFYKIKNEYIVMYYFKGSVSIFTKDKMEDAFSLVNFYNELLKINS